MLTLGIEWCNSVVILHGYNNKLYFQFTVKYYKCTHVVCAPGVRSIYKLGRFDKIKTEIVLCLDFISIILKYYKFWANLCANNLSSYTIIHSTIKFPALMYINFRNHVVLLKISKQYERHFHDDVKLFSFHL